jgi:hypothetical protein
MDAITKCTEEELAPFFTWPFRHRDGWRWLPFYLRGPAMPGIVGPLLTPLGIWLFSRRPRRLVDIPEPNWKDCRILRTCSFLGSYGMGGPGFLGLRCVKQRRFWIVFTLWSADSWLTLDGKLLESGLLGDEKKTYAQRGIVSLDTIHGANITSIEFEPERAAIQVTKGDALHTLELRRDGTTVPPWRGTGGKKKFGDEEKLEDALVISRRARLWTVD